MISTITIIDSDDIDSQPREIIILICLCDVDNIFT